jgi:hypothetical protein
MTAVIERLVEEIRSAGSYNANANLPPEGDGRDHKSLLH